jgi:hypothetical protein
MGGVLMVQQGRTGASDDEKKQAGGMLLLQNLLNFVLLRWQRINWPEVFDDADEHFDRLRVELAGMRALLWREFVLGWTWAVRVWGQIAMIIGRVWKRFWAKRRERWGAIAMFFGRWLKLAVGRKTEESLGEMKAVHGFLAATPLSPFRLIAAALAVALVSVATWGAWGWYIELPPVRAERDLLKEREGTILAANTALSARVLTAEKQNAELRQAAQDQDKKANKALADFGAREAARRAATAMSEKRKQEIRNALGLDAGGAYLDQWLREHAGAAGGDQPAGQRAAAP